MIVHIEVVTCLGVLIVNNYVFWIVFNKRLLIPYRARILRHLQLIILVTYFSAFRYIYSLDFLVNLASLGHLLWKCFIVAIIEAKYTLPIFKELLLIKDWVTHDAYVVVIKICLLGHYILILVLESFHRFTFWRGNGGGFLLIILSHKFRNVDQIPRQLFPVSILRSSSILLLKLNEFLVS